MKLFYAILMTAIIFLAVSCSVQSEPESELTENIEKHLTGDATLSIVGLPEGAKVVTLSWFPGRADDNPQGEIYKYTDGMTIPAGKILLLIESDGYEPLIGSRIPVFDNTVLEAKMCEVGEGCYGTLTKSELNE